MYLERMEEKLRQIKNPYLRAAAPFFIVSGGSLTLTLILFIACRFPYVCENIYVPMALFISTRVARASVFFSFSFGEVLVCALLIWLTAYSAVTFFRLVKKPDRLLNLIRYGLSAVTVASVLVFLYTLMWGQSYYRYPLAQRMGLDVYDRPVEEVYKLGVKIIGDMENDAAASWATNPDSRGRTPDFDKMANAVSVAASKHFGVGYTPEVKPVMASEVLAHLNITGIYMPLTGEANVSLRETAAFLPMTMAHETAHRMCTAREDEANFEAYLMLASCDDPFLRYSARMMALAWVGRALSRYDGELYSSLWELYPEGVKRDFKENSDFWAQYDTPVADAGLKVNDVFLKSQGQMDGSRSYGRALDLLLALYEDEI